MNQKTALSTRKIVVNSKKITSCSPWHSHSTTCWRRKKITEQKNNDTNHIDLRKYAGRGEKMLDIDAQEYVNQLRSNDRI